MLDVSIVGRSYKIGQNWIFDKLEAKGYKLIRKNGQIVDFSEVYQLVKNEKNEYDVKATTDIPMGIVRKSIEILEKV